MKLYEKISHIKQLTDSIGTIYGTEDFSVFLYSLIKMKRPNTVVELGTGVGTAMLWSALAMEENGFGSFITVDDGSEWQRISQVAPRFSSYYREDYATYINSLIKTFEFENQIQFVNKRIDVVDVEDTIDILFSDFAHSVYDIVKLLVQYLPKMSADSVLFIDSASTNFSSMSMLEKTVELFNMNQVPLSMLELSSNPHELQQIVSSHRFSVEHIIENKDRAQNSTAMIRMTPIDIFPHPRVNLKL